MAMIINGEKLTDYQVDYYRRVLRNDCIKFAGGFHNMNRSAKFLANWPNEYEYAETNWKNFVVSVRAMYAARLGQPNTPPDEAEIMHRALVVDTMTNEELAGRLIEGDTSLQLAPDSQQFAGDKKENAGIVDKFGPDPHALRKLLMSTGARFH